MTGADTFTLSALVMDCQGQRAIRAARSGTAATARQVEAGIERISRDRTVKALSNSCLFTFANVDGDLQHHPVPTVYPTTYAEDARYLAAHRSLDIVLRHRTLI